jgi:hypothetical protein
MAELFGTRLSRINIRGFWVCSKMAWAADRPGRW